MSFINILHKKKPKEPSNTIHQVEICDCLGVECPRCELVLDIFDLGQHTCPFCKEVFMVV